MATDAPPAAAAAAHQLPGARGRGGSCGRWGFAVAVAAIVVAAVSNYTNAVPPPTDCPELAGHVAAGAFFNWNGHAIFYRASSAAASAAPHPWAATGKPLLLALHGFPTSSWDWAPMWAPLAANYTVLAFDFLGFGLSDKPARHVYSLREQADIAAALVATVAPQVRAYLLLAHDYGTSVAQELLARYVDAGGVPSAAATAVPAAVVLLNGGIIAAAHRPLLVQRALAHKFLGPLLKPLAVNVFTFRASLARVFGAAAPLAPAAASLHWALFAHKGGPAVIDRLLGYMAERVAADRRWQGALFTSPAPVAVINGPDDPVSGSHLLAAYARARAAALAALGAQVRPSVAAARRADATVPLAPGVGHYPQLEAAPAVLAAMAAWLPAALATGAAEWQPHR